MIFHITPLIKDYWPIIPKYLFGLILSIFLINYAHADKRHTSSINEISSDQQSIHLEELIKEALEKSPMLRMNKYETERKNAQIGPKGSYEDPMIEVEAMDYPASSLNPDRSDMRSHQLSVSQKIPFPGKLTEIKNAAIQEYKAQKEMYKVQELELIKIVKMIYYNLCLLTKKKEIFNEQLGLIRQLISATKNQYILGKISQAELINFQLEEAGLLEQVVTLEKEMNLRKGDLNHALGREQHHILGKVQEFKMNSIEFSEINKEKIGERVIENNPSFKSKKYEVQAAENNLAYSKKGYLPDFEFKMTYNKPSDSSRMNSYSGMIGISIPLWFSSKQSEEIKDAVAQKSSAEAKLEEEKIHLLHMVHSLYSELEEANKKVKLYKEGLLPLSRQALISGKSAYLTGKMEYATLHNIIKTRFQTEFSYHEYMVQYETKVVELENLIGERLESIQ